MASSLIQEPESQYWTLRQGFASVEDARRAAVKSLTGACVNLNELRYRIGRPPACNDSLVMSHIENAQRLFEDGNNTDTLKTIKEASEAFHILEYKEVGFRGDYGQMYQGNVVSDLSQATAIIEAIVRHGEVLEEASIEAQPSEPAPLPANPASPPNAGFIGRIKKWGKRQK